MNLVNVAHLAINGPGKVAAEQLDLGERPFLKRCRWFSAGGSGLSRCRGHRRRKREERQSRVFCAACDAAAVHHQGATQCLTGCNRFSVSFSKKAAALRTSRRHSSRVSLTLCIQSMWTRRRAGELPPARGSLVSSVSHSLPQSCDAMCQFTPPPKVCAVPRSTAAGGGARLAPAVRSGPRQVPCPLGSLSVAPAQRRRARFFDNVEKLWPRYHPSAPHSPPLV